MGDIAAAFKGREPVFAYLRVSTAEQKKKGSLERQETQLKGKLKDFGVNPKRITWYKDGGVSGTWSREKRPQYEQMLKDALELKERKGKEVLFAVTDGSRFSRHPNQYGRDVIDLIDPAQARLIAIKDNIVTSNEKHPSISDDMLLGILQNMWRQEVATRRGQTIEGQSALFEQGLEKGGWYNLYPDAALNVHRLVADNIDLVDSESISLNKLGKYVNFRGGVKKTRSGKEIPAVAKSWAKNNAPSGPYKRLKKIREEKGEAYLEDWLDLVDRIISFEKQYGEGTARGDALRYRTNGTLRLNPNAPTPSEWTDEALQYVVDNWTTMQSAKQKKMRGTKEN